MIRRVVKVGGSLLKRKELVVQISRWTQHQSPAQNLFLFGGGDMINSVRDLDQIHSLDAKMAHWICVELLDASFNMADRWFSDWGSIQTTMEFCELVAKQPCLSNSIVKCTSFYHCGQAGELPQDWRTTTDSIAARLAVLSNASELVLLKSCPVDRQLSHGVMAEQGIVDEAFPGAAESIASVRVEPLA